MKNKKFFLCIVTFIALLVSLSSIAESQAAFQDPYEKLNKQTFKFNNDLDIALFQPIARGYASVVPRPVRTSIGNFYQNLTQPSLVANDILQGDYLNAMADSWRFFINSTLGLFGFFDVATQMNVPIDYRVNDFGLTLMYWGVNDPKYFVIPLFGPSTDVDFLGRLVNYYAFTPYPYIHPWYDRTILLGIYYLNTRAQLLDYNNLMSIASIDPYVFQRNAYLQHRKNQLARIKQDIHNEYVSAQDTEPGYFLKPSVSN